MVGRRLESTGLLVKPYNGIRGGGKGTIGFIPLTRRVETRMMKNATGCEKPPHRKTEHTMRERYRPARKCVSPRRCLGRLKSLVSDRWGLRLGPNPTSGSGCGGSSRLGIQSGAGAKRMFYFLPDHADGRVCTGSLKLEGRANRKIVMERS